MNPKIQLLVSLLACLILLGVLIAVLVRVDNSDDLRTCDSVANEEVRHIPARCLHYYLDPGQAEQTPE